MDTDSVGPTLRDVLTSEGGDDVSAAGPLVVLDPAAQAFVVAAQTRLPSIGESVTAHRAAFVEMQRENPSTPIPLVAERWVTIGTEDHGCVRVHIVVPTHSVGPLAVVLYLHGGGWVNGDASTHRRIVRELSLRTGAAVIFPEYTRSPEARYPVAVEQAYETALWIVSHGAEHGLDPTRVAAAGDSEGANLVLAIVLMAMQRSPIRFLQLVLFTPVTDADFSTESYRTFAQGYGLRRDAMQWYWDQYAPARAAREQPTVCPLRADTSDLARFPPSLIITAEADVVRDEGEALAQRLRAAGSPSAAVRYEGTIHDFVVLSGLQHSGAAKAATAQAAAILRDAFAVPGDDRLSPITT
jgi:acetyl esterase